MKKNLTARTVVIVVTLLLCIYGIIGFPTSKASLIRARSMSQPPW